MSSCQDNENEDLFEWTKRSTHIPIFMIPSMAGSRLRTWSHRHCSALVDFNVGGTVWLDVKRMLLATNCWINCIKLDPTTQDDKDCVVRPDEGLDAISQVDESVPAGFLWQAFIHMLGSNGYVPEGSMFAHPYDWRMPPGLLQMRDRTFSRLKTKIETVVAEYEERHPMMQNRGVGIVALSLGNLFVQYFFNFLRREMGSKRLEEWTTRHIYATAFSGAPFLGAIGPLRALIVGDTNGLPISKEQSRDIMLTFGSMPWMMPHRPSASNPVHVAANGGESDFPLNPIVKITLANGTVVERGSDDILREGGWLGGLDVRLRHVQAIIDRWYKNDEHVGNRGDVFVPWTPPNGIDHVICVYGTNVDTPVQFEYRESEKYPGYYEEVDTATNRAGRITSSASGRSALEPERELRERKSGDGTVPYFSLSWCQSWLGDRANVTRVPSGRSYEQDDIVNYRNVDLTDLSERRRIDGSGGRHNTYLTKRWVERDPLSGLQRTRSIQVWEMDGVKHRDSVTDPRVLSQMQQVIVKSHEANLKYREIVRKVRRDAWRKIDASGLLEQNPIEEAALEAATWSDTKKPTTNDECYWDYRNARCAWLRYCVYDFVVGDLHLSQSCRLRPSPLPHDHPILREMDRSDYASQANRTDTQIEWRFVYADGRNIEPLFEPWQVILLSSVCAAIVLGIAGWIVFRTYHESIVAALQRHSSKLKQSAKRGADTVTRRVLRLRKASLFESAITIQRRARGMLVRTRLKGKGTRPADEESTVPSTPPRESKASSKADEEAKTAGV